MTRPRPSTLTPAQQAQLEALLAGESHAEDLLSPAVVQALEERLMSVTIAAPRAGDLTTRVDDGAKELLTAIEAALLVGISLSTFVRSVERNVETVRTPQGPRYRRAELLAVGEERVRRRRRAAGP